MGANRSRKATKARDSTTRKPVTLRTGRSMLPSLDSETWLNEALDAIIAIKPHFVQLIAQRKKNHECRKYKLASVQRLWLYETAPKSMIT